MLPSGAETLPDGRRCSQGAGTEQCVEGRVPAPLRVKVHFSSVTGLPLGNQLTALQELELPQFVKCA